MDGITEITNGMMILVVPDTVSSSGKTINLNINGLGNKTVYFAVLGKNLSGALASSSDGFVGFNTANFGYLLICTNGEWFCLSRTAPHVDGLMSIFGGEVYAKSTCQAPATSLLRNSSIVSSETTPR